MIQSTTTLATWKANMKTSKIALLTAAVLASSPLPILPHKHVVPKETTSDFAQQEKIRLAEEKRQRRARRNLKHK